MSLFSPNTLNNNTRGSIAHYCSGATLLVTATLALLQGLSLDLHNIIAISRVLDSSGRELAVTSSKMGAGAAYSVQLINAIAAKRGALIVQGKLPKLTRLSYQRIEALADAATAIPLEEVHTVAVPGIRLDWPANGLPLVSIDAEPSRQVGLITGTGRIILGAHEYYAHLRTRSRKRRYGDWRSRHGVQPMDDAEIGEALRDVLAGKVPLVFGNLREIVPSSDFIGDVEEVIRYTADETLRHVEPVDPQLWHILLSDKRSFDMRHFFAFGNTEQRRRALPPDLANFLMTPSLVDTYETYIPKDALAAHAAEAGITDFALEPHVGVDDALRGYVAWNAIVETLEKFPSLRGTPEEGLTYEDVIRAQLAFRTEAFLERLWEVEYTAKAVRESRHASPRSRRRPRSRGE